MPDSLSGGVCSHEYQAANPSSQVSTPQAQRLGRGDSELTNFTLYHAYLVYDTQGRPTDFRVKFFGHNGGLVIQSWYNHGKTYPITSYRGKSRIYGYSYYTARGAQGLPDRLTVDLPALAGRL